MDVIHMLQKLNESEQLDLDIKMLSIDNQHIDLLIEINREKIFVEEKYEVRPNQVQQIREQAQRYDHETFLLASNYITPGAKELLNKYKINYLDSGGNIKLRLKNGYIHVEGKHVTSPSEDYKNRAFTKVGAKLIFTFLKNPEHVNLSYRTLSELSTCSLGSITKILDHLKEERYIITLPNSKLKLVQQDKLMDKWIDVLSNQLLPSMLLGTYRFVIDNSWHTLDLKRKNGYQWGGEVAASLLTNNLNPQEFSIYTSKGSNESIKELKLIPDRSGPLKIYKIFWKDEYNPAYTDTVDPILIYGELVASADSRNLEIANEIKNKYFKHDEF